jgi:hypothetical protein
MLSISHGNNGYANAPYFYVTRTFPVFRDLPACTKAIASHVVGISNRSYYTAPYQTACTFASNRYTLYPCCVNGCTGNNLPLKDVRSSKWNTLHKILFL